jgi:hypothetical protein
MDAEHLLNINATKILADYDWKKYKSGIYWIKLLFSEKIRTFNVDYETIQKYNQKILKLKMDKLIHTAQDIEKLDNWRKKIGECEQIWALKRAYDEIYNNGKLL